MNGNVKSVRVFVEKRTAAIRCTVTDVQRRPGHGQHLSAPVRTVRERSREQRRQRLIQSTPFPARSL